MSLSWGETRIECHQVTHDGSEFDDGFRFVLCVGCQDRIVVETATHLHGYQCYYVEGTVIVGIAGWSLRAACSWKCASKAAATRAKNLKGR